VRIEKYTILELKEKYYKIHDEVFPKDKFHIPGTIYLVFDDDYVGFVSGYFHDLRTFYIQRTAKSKDFSLKLARQVWQHMKGEGIRFLLGQVETENKRAIITALRTGWTINGYFTNTNGKPFIRIIMDLGD